MPQPPSGYRDLLDKAQRQTMAGSAIDMANSVYYECRSPLRFSRKQSKDEGKFFQGKINGIAADCIAISPAEKSNIKLSGRAILFVCYDEPDEPHLFQRTGTHKGQWGLLKDRVTCKISIPYENIPDTR